MQIFCLFFCVLYVIYCELGGKITQSMQVCLSKTSPPLNKSTFYIRLTALFAGVGILFSQRFASLHIGLNYYALSGLLQWSAISFQAVSYQPTPQHLNARRASLLNQLLCVRLSVFDDAHEVQSCRQSGHRDLERRLIRPERAQHRHTAPELDFVSASVGREYA